MRKQRKQQSRVIKAFIRNELARMAGQDLSLQQAADELDMSYYSIWSIAKEAGITFKGKRQRTKRQAIIVRADHDVISAVKAEAAFRDVSLSSLCEEIIRNHFKDKLQSPSLAA